MPIRRTFTTWLPRLLSCLWLAAPVGAAAESSFLLAYPANFGSMPAATYDEAGERIGGADLRVEQLESGLVRVRSESGQQSGAQTVALAELEPDESMRGLRMLLQESRSLDPEGNALGVLSVDHRRKIASCRGADGEIISEMQLPDSDRVVNVPMNLLFQPLVRGEKQSLKFQIFLCRPNARLIDFRAWAVRRGVGTPIEIRYGPDFGFASSLARRLAPKLSFWFDPRAPYDWVGHRLPLYSGGPEVFVVRDDVTSSSLVD
jgi:hypothetical protein